MAHERLEYSEIRPLVSALMEGQKLVDMHTHASPPSFGTPVANATGRTDPAGMMLWGVDELLTYHYLVAEVYRVVPAAQLPYERFWKMTKREQADHIWKHLFIERAPISEACRGVLTAIQRLGLDPTDPTPARWREFFEAQDPSEYIDRVMEVANVRSITMTNPVFDDNERQRWQRDANGLRDKRFRAVLRIDPLLRGWPGAAAKLSQWGFAADEQVTPKSIESGRRFLRDWLDRMNAIYI